ncbi:hypothetical protein V6N11_039497 [Hibiscus sabdariffa]|uniref:Uncharacterized protein n=1 Tax=Hibiscus sabdariffa TaxID=183260 RepID=A0ABR2SP02_9ROSI
MLQEQKTQSEQMNKCMAEVVEEALVEDEEEEELREFSATIANGMGMFKQCAGGNKIKKIILKKEKRIARRSWHGLIQKRIANRCGFLTVDVLTT